MKYTKEQLRDMSDHQLNKTLADMLGLMWHIKPNEFSRRWEYCNNYEGLDGVELPDYCNNPSDIMPVALSHKVGIMPYDMTEDHEEYNDYKDMWFAQQGVFDHETSFDSKNPLRAITCCLILILQEEL